MVNRSGMFLPRLSRMSTRNLLHIHGLQMLDSHFIPILPDRHLHRTHGTPVFHNTRCSLMMGVTLFQDLPISRAVTYYLSLKGLRYGLRSIQIMVAGEELMRSLTTDCLGMSILRLGLVYLQVLLNEHIVIMDVTFRRRQIFIRNGNTGRDLTRLIHTLTCSRTLTEFTALTIRQQVFGSRLCLGGHPRASDTCRYLCWPPPRSLDSRVKLPHPQVSGSVDSTSHPRVLPPCMTLRRHRDLVCMTMLPHGLAIVQCGRRHLPIGILPTCHLQVEDVDTTVRLYQSLITLVLRQIEIAVGIGSALHRLSTLTKRGTGKGLVPNTGPRRRV